MTPNRTDPFELERIAPLDLGRLAWSVWYGKWIIAASMVAMVTLGVYYGFHVSQPRFAATATLRIDPQPADVRDVSEHWPAPPTDAASLATEVAILSSRRILGQVVQGQALLDNPEFNRYLVPAGGLSVSGIRDALREWIGGEAPHVPDEADVFDKTVSNLRASLTVSQPSDTYLFEVTIQSRDPETAARLANAVAAAYVAAQIDDRDDAARADIAWLGTRVAELRQRLQWQEAEITAQRAAAQVQDVRGLDALSADVRDTEQDRSDLIAALAALPQDADLSPRQSAVRSQLADELQQLTAQRARLTTQLAAQSAGLTALQQSERDADATRILYEAFLGRLQEAQVQRGLDATAARILAPATTGRYIGPRRVLIVQVAALLGMILGLGLVMLRHLSRRGILHPQMLAAATGQPVAATFSRQEITGKGTACERLNTALMLANSRRMPQAVLVCGADRSDRPADLIGLLCKRPKEDRKGVLIVSTPDAPGLTSVPDHADRIMMSPETLTDTAGLEAAFTDWRARYGLIAILAGPATGASSAVLLADYADMTVLGIRFAATHTENVAAAHARLQAAATTPVITVLTHVRPRRLRQFTRCYGPVSVPI